VTAASQGAWSLESTVFFVPGLPFFCHRRSKLCPVLISFFFKLSTDVLFQSLKRKEFIVALQFKEGNGSQENSYAPVLHGSCTPA
jgi:hypothetical protein